MTNVLEYDPKSDKEYQWFLWVEKRSRNGGIATVWEHVNISFYGAMRLLDKFNFKISGTHNEGYKFALR